MKASVVILAAGEGTRMSSNLPKSLQFLAGKTMLGHIKQAIRGLEIDQTIIVCSPNEEERIKKADSSPDQQLI